MDSSSLHSAPIEVYAWTQNIATMLGISKRIDPSIYVIKGVFGPRYPITVKYVPNLSEALYRALWQTYLSCRICNVPNHQSQSIRLPVTHETHRTLHMQHRTSV